MKKVLVTWVDIGSQSGWHTQNKLDNFVADDKSYTVTQLGFLYEEDDDHIVLLDSYFPNMELFGAPTKIPKGCIVSIQELRLK